MAQQSSQPPVVAYRASGQITDEDLDSPSQMLYGLNSKVAGFGQD